MRNKIKIKGTVEERQILPGKLKKNNWKLILKYERTLYGGWKPN